MQFHKSVVQRMIRGPDGKISKMSIIKQHNGKKGILYINKNGKKKVESFKIRCKPKGKTQNKKVSKVNKTKKRRKSRKSRKNKTNSLNNAGNVRKSLFKKNKMKKRTKKKSKKRENSKGFWHNFWGV